MQSSVFLTIEESIAFAQRKDVRERYNAWVMVKQVEDGLHTQLLSTQSMLELLELKNIDA